MRVLHLHASVLYGGVETFLFTLARETHLTPDVEHIFTACFESRYTNEIRSTNHSVHMMGQARFSRPWTIIQTRLRLRKLIQQYKPDIAICHLCKPLFLYGAELKRCGVPSVLYLHAPLAPGLFENLCKRTPPNHMIGVSKHTLQTGHQLLFPDVEGTVINYPMPWNANRFDCDDEDIVAFRKEVNTPEDAVVIVQATRMNAWKGHKELLDALSLMKHIPNWVMWIIGGPQKAAEELYFENLITVAKDYGISDRVMFLGQQKNVPQFLAAADVYCQANTGSEGFSLSFTEAFTAGLPIVTTDIGSAQEIVDPRVGILTPVGDKEALATALISLTENSELRRSMSRNTRAWIKGLSDTNQQICLLRETLAKVCKST